MPLCRSGSVHVPRETVVGKVGLGFGSICYSPVITSWIGLRKLQHAPFGWALPMRVRDPDEMV